MKRIFVLLLCALLLAGCGTGSADPKETAGTEDTTADTTAQTETETETDYDYSGGYYDDYSGSYDNTGEALWY